MRRIEKAWRWTERQWAIHASELACLFAVLALLLGLLTVVQWGELRRRQMPADWGNVPGWVGALGTLAAFGALAVTLFEWRANWANQARLVVPQPAQSDSSPKSLWDRAAHDDVVIHNHSSSPVFDLEIDSLEYGPDDRQIWENLDGQNRVAPKRAVFRCGESTGRLTVVGQIEGGIEATNPAIRYLVFTFTDANGRRWRRTGTNQPERVHG